MAVYFDPFLEILFFILEFDDTDVENDDGLSDLQMQRIDVINRSLIQDTECCPICLESFIEQESSVLRQLACRHYYHENCLFHWLQSHNTCPVCRFLLNNVQQQRIIETDNEADNIVGNPIENEMRMSSINPSRLPNLNQLPASNSAQNNSQRNSIEPVIRRNPRRAVRRYRTDPITPSRFSNLSQSTASNSAQNNSQIISIEPVIRRNPRRTVRRDINYSETRRYMQN